MKPSENEVLSLLEKLDFSPEEVLVTASQQPGLFRDAIKYRMKCFRENMAAEMALKTIRATRALNLRDDAREAGDKMTEGNLAEMLLVDQKATAAQLRCNQTEEDEEYSKLVLEAFRMRRDCLEIVGGLMRTERSVESSTRQLAETREQLRRKYPAGRK